MTHHHTTAVAAPATSESDATIARRERANGAEAKRQGFPRESCPWRGGLTKQWWLEGYDNPLAGIVAVAN